MPTLDGEALAHRSKRLRSLIAVPLLRSRCSVRWSFGDCRHARFERGAQDDKVSGLDSGAVLLACQE
jgi:hypothetical protein